MPPKKRKRSRQGTNHTSAFNETDASAANFQVVVKPAKSHTSLTYTSDFDPRLNLEYEVQLDGNKSVWSQLRSFKSFQVEDENDTKIYVPVNSFVCVRGILPGVVEPQKPQGEDSANLNADDEDEVEFETWIAQVLECRAANNANVFLRVVWLYWPDDLQDYGGRRDYHGQVEVIPSNHMQIINAVSVAAKVAVERWDDATEANHVSRSDSLFWRQTLNVHGAKKQKARRLSPAPTLHCVCHQPANPDLYLVQCGACLRFMHEECIIGDAIKRAPDTDPRVDTDDHPPDTKDATEPDGVATAPRQSLMARMVAGVLQGATNAPVRMAKAAVDEVLSPPRKKQKLVKSSEDHSYGAELKETSAEDASQAPTILVFNYNASGREKEWEQPVHCLFKDCVSLLT